jgi:hypothetical protein
VQDALPALEFPGRDELGPASAGLGKFEDEAQAVGIRPPAGVTEMVVDDIFVKWAHGGRE